MGQALALIVGGVWSRSVGARLPFDAHPAQVFHSTLYIARPTALWVEVFIAINEFTMMSPRTLGRDVEGSQMPQVEMACRAGGESSAVGGWIGGGHFLYWVKSACETFLNNSRLRHLYA